MAESTLSEGYWAEAINTACYVQNRVLINKVRQKTPYELYFGRKPNVDYFHIFGCKCYVSNNGKEKLSTFQAKADEAIFLGYSNTSKAFKVLNLRTKKFEESCHVKFSETQADFKEHSEKQLGERMQNLLLYDNSPFVQELWEDDSHTAGTSRQD